jgi:galactose-1-phosphate uridylyltransferase
MENRPVEQKGIPFEKDFTILCNPYPVFSRHFTIVSNEHKPQSIIGNLPVMLRLAQALPTFVIFYNGPECGASAPMHLHFQAGVKQEFPIYNDFATLKNRFSCTPETSSLPFIIKDGIRTFYVLEGNNPEALVDLFTQEFCHEDKEPNLNILAWSENNRWTVCIFKRKQHRPSQFYEEGDAQILISPATIEMAGLFITPRLIDFETVNKADLCDIYKQVIELLEL